MSYTSTQNVTPISMLPDLNELKVKVVNCTPNSALDCFEKDELGRALSK